MDMTRGWRCPHYRLGICINPKCFRDRACAHTHAPLPEHVSEPVKRVMENLRGE
jgi:hypothetical protein